LKKYQIKVRCIIFKSFLTIGTWPLRTSCINEVKTLFTKGRLLVKIAFWFRCRYALFFNFS
jgi:hypothetical protein